MLWRKLRRLKQQLKASSWGERDRAEKELVKLGADAVKTLIVALLDFDLNERYRAARALGEIGDKRAVEPLIDALKDADRNVAANAESALEKLGVAAVEPLIVALKDTDSNVRRYAVKALAKLGDERAVGPLIVALMDSDSDVRQNAVEALGAVGDKRAIESLIALLMGADDTTWTLAISPLLKLGWKPTSEEERLRSAVAANKWEEVGGFGQVGVPYLLKALRTGYYTGRASYIAAGLTRADSKWRESEQVISILPELLADLADAAFHTDSEEKCLRENAACALGYIGDLRAVEPLIGVLTSKNAKLQWTAMEALGQIGDGRAVEPLKRALVDDNPSTRDRAAQVLKSFGWQPMKVPPSALSDDQLVAILQQLCEAYARSDKQAVATLEPQATAIGEFLDTRGGIMEMRRIFDKIPLQNGRRTLEMHWGGIGDWRG